MNAFVAAAILSVWAFGQVEAPRAPRRPVIAVFAPRFASSNIPGANEPGVAAAIASKARDSAAFRVVPHDLLAERLAAVRATGRSCDDVPCRFGISRGAGASKVLDTEIALVAERCVVTAIVFDLESMARENAAVETSACDANEIMNAFERVVGTMFPREGRIADNAATLSRAGNAAIHAGDLTSARTALERCVAIDPNHAACHRSLAIAYAQLSYAKRSIHHYRRYVELAPNADDAERVRVFLRSTREE